MDENADDDEILQGLEDAVGEDEEPEEEEDADEIDASVEVSDVANYRQGSCRSKH